MNSNSPLVVTATAWMLLVGLLSLSAGPSQQPLFREIPPSESGIHWVHENAMSDQRYLPETMGPGAAFLDYNQNGWMDLYMVNSGPSDFYTPEEPLRNALYRNNGDGTFTDVTLEAGVAGGTFGMGVATGDYTGSGYPDLFVTSYGRTILYRNNGDGTFTDVTEEAGVMIEGWTTSAVWFDFDNDGRLDLFVCSFVVFAADQHISCGMNPLGQSYYCIPRVFRPTRSYLFRNNGDGTFTEVGGDSEIGSVMGKALGVVAADVNRNGRMDLFVANDTVQNFLFMNRGNGQWEEVGLFAAVAFGLDGEVRSGMGVDAADFDGDGWDDLFVANVDRQTYSLYRNNGDESFSDVAAEHNIAEATYYLSGWGLKFFDFDNDGTIDLFLANGHPDDTIESYVRHVTYYEPLLLFQNDGQLLRNISDRAGPIFQKTFNARGMTVGDYNNNGRLDVFVVNNGDPPLLLKNEAGADNNWVGVRLQGVEANRDGVGAELRWSVNGKIQTRRKNSGGSYLSSHDLREVLGIGKAGGIEWLEVAWPGPSRRVERFENLSTNRYNTLTEGTGARVKRSDAPP